MRVILTADEIRVLQALVRLGDQSHAEEWSCHKGQVPIGILAKDAGFEENPSELGKVIQSLNRNGLVFHGADNDQCLMPDSLAVNLVRDWELEERTTRIQKLGRWFRKRFEKISESVVEKGCFVLLGIIAGASGPYLWKLPKAVWSWILSLGAGGP